MPTAPFECLQTVRLEHESRNGRAEICQQPNGTRWVRLCIGPHDRQREVLSALDESIPVRLEGGALELLLPWYGGVSLREWVHERTPTLGQRRDACLSLLEQQVEMRKKLPPCFTVLSASTVNLTVEHTSVHLQYLPELKNWKPDLQEPQAVCAIAAVIGEVLAPGSGKWSLRRAPEELQLLHRRQKERDYTSWSQLQRDVAAIPDDPPHIKPIFHAYVQRAQDRLSRYGKYILRILAAILLTAALLSLASAYLRQRDQSGPAWQGMPRVGDQDLRNEEGGG